ncbi:MAG TPA: cytochrome b/b6 domain-containing protein [Chloroflexota bacterium]|jgi:cytochrome b subunit of formate dehydrogenase
MRDVGIAALAVVLLLVGLVVSLVEASANQPWGQTLGDNFMLARSLPFTLGLGVAVGYARAHWPGRVEQRPGAVRRFDGSTVWLHWIAALAVLLGLATGAWQYLKGLLDITSPIAMPLVYRVHYIAASLLLFVIALAITDWWLRGSGSLSVAKGSWIRALRGLAHELPRPLGGTIAYMLGLDLRRAPPPTEKFTWYERTISYPTWVIAIGLIALTGILKAMRYVYPIPGDVLYWVSAIHVGAMVLLAIKVLDHVRFVLAPSRWPLMAAMVSGWVSARYAAARHPGWHVTDEPTPDAESAAAPVRPVGGRSA